MINGRIFKWAPQSIIHLSYLKGTIPICFCVSFNINSTIQLFLVRFAVSEAKVVAATHAVQHIRHCRKCKTALWPRSAKQLHTNAGVQLLARRDNERV